MTTPSKPDAESAVRVDHAGRRFRCDTVQFAEAILAELEQGQKLTEALRDIVDTYDSIARDAGLEGSIYMPMAISKARLALTEHGQSKKEGK